MIRRRTASHDAEKATQDEATPPSPKPTDCPDPLACRSCGQAVPQPAPHPDDGYGWELGWPGRSCLRCWAADRDPDAIRRARTRLADALDVGLVDDPDQDVLVLARRLRRYSAPNTATSPFDGGHPERWQHVDLEAIRADLNRRRAQREHDRTPHRSPNGRPCAICGVRLATGWTAPRINTPNGYAAACGQCAPDLDQHAVGPSLVNAAARRAAGMTPTALRVTDGPPLTSDEIGGFPLAFESDPAGEHDGQPWEYLGDDRDRLRQWAWVTHPSELADPERRARAMQERLEQQRRLTPVLRDNSVLRLPDDALDEQIIIE